MNACKFDNIFAFHLQTFLFHLMKGSKPASNADPSQLNSFPHILNPSKRSEYTMRFFKGFVVKLLYLSSNLEY